MPCRTEGLNQEKQRLQLSLSAWQRSRPMSTEQLDTCTTDAPLMTHPASAGSLADAPPRPSSLPPTRVRRRWRSDGTAGKTLFLDEAAATIAGINKDASVTKYPELLRKEKEIRAALLSRETVLTPCQVWEAIG